MVQSRRMLVLRAVIEDYIRSQEPVGSSTLARDHDLGVSSATIRNDMAVLEDDGYLVQPHTSAGRIPTDKGYRYFVDRLATVVPLSEPQRRGINNFLEGSVSLQDALQRAARLLAQITGQIAVVSAPALSKSTLRHVEIVSVSSTMALAVIITDTGRVVQRLLPVACPLEESVSASLARVITERCAGLMLSQAAEVTRGIAQGMSAGLKHTVCLDIAHTFDDMADDDHADELYTAGTSQIAQRRAVRDMASLFDALEEQVVLMRLMADLGKEAQASGGVGVAIGAETHTPGLMHASVVTSGYGTESEGADDSDAGARPVAFVGSIGPTHMDYAATMAAVRAVARYLTGFLSHDESHYGR